MVREAKRIAMLILMLLATAGCTEPGVAPTMPASIPTHAPSPTPSEAPVRGISPGIVEKLGLEELATRADCILVATVEGIRSEWSRDQTTIYTYITATVEKTVKGCLDQTEITIRVPGGQVGNVAMVVSTAPEFEVGEKVLVFLEVQEDGSLGVLGGFQGKFTVEDDVVVGRGIALPDFIKAIQESIER